MTSSTSTLRSGVVIAAAIATIVACSAPKAGVAQCNTGLVMVQFKKPLVKDDQFTIRIRTSDGEREATVVKNATGTAWSAEVEPFDVASSLLVETNVPSVRTSCNVAPQKNFKVGRKCVAMYFVDCDPLWSLKVESNPIGERFGYQLDRKIAACGTATGALETAATPRSILDIGAEDKVIVVKRTQQSFVSVLVTQKLLRTFDGAAKMSQLDPLPTTETPIFGATRYLKREQAQKNADLTFSMAGGVP